MVLRTVQGLTDVERAIIGKLRQLQQHGYGKMEITFHEHKLNRLAMTPTWTGDDLLRKNGHVDFGLGTVSTLLST